MKGGGRCRCVRAYVRGVGAGRRGGRDVRHQDGYARRDATGLTIREDEACDYDDDDFDESNIVESEGGFDSRMRSIEDLYADPSLYDRVRVPAVCDRLTQSSFFKW